MFIEGACYSCQAALQLSRVGLDWRRRTATLSYTFMCGVLCGQTSNDVLLQKIGKHWKVKYWGPAAVYRKLDPPGYPISSGRTDLLLSPMQLLVIRCHLNHGLAEALPGSTVQHLPHGAPHRVLVPAPKLKAQLVVISGKKAEKSLPKTSM